MQNAGKSILVTGGAGYIGAHACKALQKAGYQPVVYDNLVHGHRSFVRWGPFEHGDILDFERIDAVLRKHRPDAVMHFAGFAYVGESVACPEKYYQNNITGSLTLLEAMQRNKINKIVFSSSCTTFGNPEKLPIAESHTQKPLNPYGNTKLAVEAMLKDFDTAYGLKSITLRYFNAAGADPDGEVGENHNPETHLIPLVFRAGELGGPPLIVFGDDYATPDGSCIRDYIHVADLAEAHVLALAALKRSMRSNAYNVGNGIGHSVKEIVAAAEKVTGRKISIEIGPRRMGDPPRLVSDSQKAQRELGWRPKYGDIEIILQHAWAWHSSSMKRCRLVQQQTPVGPECNGPLSFLA
jgi:UDP-arabinose 4-epimerase